jgi:two-component system LytT family response regulator
MPHVRTLIVDDEPLARENLRLALNAFREWRVVADCQSAAAARQALAVEPADVVFLDVKMPGESGLGLARTLAESPDPPIVIFVTAFEDFAVEAFELHALDYLLKPFDDERFRQAVSRASDLLALRERAAYAGALRGYLADRDAAESPAEPHYLERFSVRSVGRIEAVDISRVRWIGAAGNYVELHLVGRTVLHRVTLSHLATRLDPRDFLRTHRGAIVRRRECVALRTVGDGVYVLELRGGGEVPVSERYLEAVRAALAG